MSSPIDQAVQALDVDVLQVLVRDRDRRTSWCAGILEREPSDRDLQRAGILLRVRLRSFQQARRPAVPAASQAEPAVPVSLPCPRCKVDRPCTWTASGWQRPDPCDGVECGFLTGERGAPAAPSRPEFDRAILDMRREAWAFKWYDPTLHRRNQVVIGGVTLLLDVLDLVAATTRDPEAAETCTRALELLADLDEAGLPRLIAEVPAWDLDGLDVDEAADLLDPYGADFEGLANDEALEGHGEET